MQGAGVSVYLDKKRENLHKEKRLFPGHPYPQRRTSEHNKFRWFQMYPIDSPWIEYKMDAVNFSMDGLFSIKTNLFYVIPFPFCNYVKKLYISQIFVAVYSLTINLLYITQYTILHIYKIVPVSLIICIIFYFNWYYCIENIIISVILFPP